MSPTVGIDKIRTDRDLVMSRHQTRLKTVVRSDNATRFDVDGAARGACIKHARKADPIGGVHAT
jgi:hypothetical protein